MTKPETEKLRWFVGCDAPRDGGRPFIGTTFGGHYFSLYPKDDLADAVRRHDFMMALCNQLNCAQGGGDCSLGVGDGSGQLFVHGSYDAIKACQALIVMATPDAAPDAVKVPPKAVFHSSGGVSGFNDYNCGGRIITMSVAEAQSWNNCIDEVLRLNAHARSAGGEGNGAS